MAFELHLTASFHVMLEKKKFISESSNFIPDKNLNSLQAQRTLAWNRDSAVPVFEFAPCSIKLSFQGRANMQSSDQSGNGHVHSEVIHKQSSEE